MQQRDYFVSAQLKKIDQAYTLHPSTPDLVHSLNQLNSSISLPAIRDAHQGNHGGERRGACLRPCLFSAPCFCQAACLPCLYVNVYKRTSPSPNLLQSGEAILQRSDFAALCFPSVMPLLGTVSGREDKSRRHMESVARAPYFKYVYSRTSCLSVVVSAAERFYCK